MALSRILAQSLPHTTLRPPTAALISHHRHRSNKSHHAHLIELDLDSSSPSDSPESAAEILTVRMKKLEDAIHSIIVRRAAPDWLPFLPGYSYYVPPRASPARGRSAGSMIDVIGRLASTSAAAARNNGRLEFDLLSEDEQMALTSGKGWPSASFFIEGTSPVNPIPVVEVEVNIQVNENVDDTSKSADEEG